MSRAEPRPVPTPAAVERELAALWRAGDGERPVVRACALNLVIACDDGDDDARAATAIAARTAESEPSRVLLIARPGGRGEELDIHVSAHCHRDRHGREVCSEQVTLTCRDDGVALVPQTVLQLLVEDLPVYTWWRRSRIRRDPLFEPLCELSDRLVVDTARFADPGHGVRALQAVASSPGWKGHLLDMGWLRQEPWRESLASLFDREQRREALRDVRALRVVAGGADDQGLTTAGAMLVGWLASRLGWRFARGAWCTGTETTVALTLERDPDSEPGELRSIELDCRLQGTPLRARVERAACGGGFVTLAVDEHTPRTIGLPERDDAAILCGTLQRGPNDPTFEAALAAAATMTG